MHGCARCRRVGRRAGPEPLLECRESRTGRPFHEEAMSGRVEVSGGSKLDSNEESGVQTSKRLLVVEREKSKRRRSLDHDRSGPVMSLPGGQGLARNDQGRRADATVVPPSGHPGRMDGCARTLLSRGETREGRSRCSAPLFAFSGRPVTGRCFRGSLLSASAAG